ncbi:hypothetical protein Poli38472_000028 [Pythium oligandrum]|uniref:non-specific serine/threonine protein kinase n=1 Tax=Pythium oligandrum TaxID=41045 RepID=A0A8K1FEZ6_PYTOL|nr:hypothetical protein Poli38472_000028 [Pythium oligandrum]|eukprot:TMW59986.1 hypothetical protein Poli38472_000028 [Pythium oligandrum]
MLQTHARPRGRGLVDEQEEAKSSSSTALTPFGLDRSARQIHLHAYDATSRPAGYVEVKIGGHPLDHKRILDTHRPHEIVRGPLKTASSASSTWFTPSRHSPAYEAQERVILEYSPVKIGGHALDHLPFVNRGQPSRPLWGYTPYVAPSVIFSGRPSAATAAFEQVQRGFANLYDCSRCRRLRQSPRVQLCCGHAICASCLSSQSMKHVEHGSSLCFLECVQCSEFITIEAVVFPNRVLHVQVDESVRSLSDLSAQLEPREAALVPFKWKFGGAVGALMLVAGRVMSQLSSPRKRVEVVVDPVDATTAIIDSDRSVENGSTRWKKRVQGLRPPSKLLKYAFVRTLGIGNFAEVMLVERKSHQKKNTPLSVLKESDKLQEAVNEIHLLSKIENPHVVRIHQYFIEEIGHRHFAYIEMEYCDQGDLLRMLQDHGALDSSKFDAIFRQLCLGLAEIHRCGIVHRDLKPSNVLLTSDGIAKIADFGVSTRLESDLLTHHAAGTLAFMAPEVRRYFLGEDVSYDSSADIWSLGALAVAMLTGDPEPRVATRPAEEVAESLFERGVAERHATLVRDMLEADPHKRPSLSTLVEMFPPMSARL